MESRLRPSLALLISALVHGGIALALLGQASRHAGEGGSAAGGGPALVVSLVSAGQPVRHESAATPALAATKGAVPAAEGNAPAAAEEAVADSEGAAQPGARPLLRHYFGAGEVTAAPVAAEGIFDPNLLIVPGMKPQALTVEIWVSDEGMVDRVEVEAPLTEAQQQLLREAFAKVRFIPGRIGRIAVHSRLSMRILVDYVLRA